MSDAAIPATLALLRPPVGGPGPVAGGLGLVERWTKGLARARIEARVTDPVALPASLAAATAPVLVADGGAVLDYDALNRLAASRVEDDEAVAFRDDSGALAPAVLLGASAARRLAASGGDLPALQAAAGRTVELHGACWPQPTDARAAAAVTRAMLARLRLRPGGLIARHVNRHFSIRWTYWLLKTPLTPNHITTVTGILALLASAAMLPAGYLWGLLGGLLMQVSSIVDGCDGEVARIRYQQSEFGKWYDSAWDEVVNALFLAAVGWHVSVTHEGFGWALWAGVFAGTANFLYGAANFHCKWVTGVGLYWWFDKPPAPRPADAPPAVPTLWSEMKTLSGRDAYLFVFFLAAASGVALPWFLAFIAALSSVFFVLLFIHVVVIRGTW